MNAKHVNVCVSLSLRAASSCHRSVSTIRNQRYHIHANLSFAILVAQILLLISFRFEPGTVRTLALSGALKK